MNHLVLKALAGPALLLASNTGLAQEKPPGAITPIDAARTQDPVKPDFTVPGFTARELKAKAAGGELVKLRAVPMPDGTMVDADLRPWDPFGPDFSLQFSSRDKRGKSVRRVLEMQDMTLLKGHVRGKKDSMVLIAAQGDRMEGFFSYEGATAQLTRDTSQPAPRDVIRVPEKKEPLPRPEGSGCGIEFDEFMTKAASGLASGGLAGEETDDCYVIRLALELDYELYNDRLGGDGLATIVYIAKLIYTTDEVVRRNLGAQVELALVNVWTEPDDPWTMGYFTSQLNQFIDYCNDPANDMLDVPRDATLLLSGRPIGGGQAGGIGALACHRSDRAYLVCGHMSGDFPYPAFVHHDDNWDILHFIHELGHLLNGQHTHLFDPPLDTCVSNPHVPQRGTVMSYCHSCPGGDKNIGLKFHMRNQERARDYFSTIDCLQGRASSILAYDDEAAVYQDSSTRIDVLANDSAVCSGSFIDSHDMITERGGLVRLRESAGQLERDVLHYMPPLGYLGTDSFSYQAIDGHGNISMAQVVVEVEPVPFLQAPEYLVVDTIDNSISRFDADTHEFKGDFLPEFPEFLDMPSSILPLPDTSVLVGDRSLQKVLQLDINGEYQGVFFEHPDLVLCEAMVESGGQVFILDAYGGWVFRTGLSGGYQGALFEGSGTGTDMTVGDDGTLWIIGSVNGNELVGINPDKGSIRHAIPDLEGIDSPAAIAFLNGEVMVVDGDSGAIGYFDPHGSGDAVYWEYTELNAAAAWLGGGVDIIRVPADYLDDVRYGLTTTEGLVEFDYYGTLSEISRNGCGHLESAGAVAYRAMPETSPDLNMDGCVDGGDLALLLSYFNQPIGSFPRGDLDRNGVIDGADLTILLGAWTSCP